MALTQIVKKDKKPKPSKLETAFKFLDLGLGVAGSASDVGQLLKKKKAPK